MKRIFITLSILSMILLPGCAFNGKIMEGSGVIATENRSVAAINTVILNGIGDLIIVPGSEDSLSIETDDNLLSCISTTVKNHTLIIDVKKEFDIYPTSVLKYTLVLSNFTGAELNGMGSIRAQNLDTDRVSFVINGVGDITASGTVQNLTAAIHGTGDLHASNLRSSHASFTMSGVGDAKVWVTDSLSATISGVGSVSYYGKPTVSSKISGVGSCKRLGDK